MPPVIDQEFLEDRYPEHLYSMRQIIEVPGDPIIHLRHVDYTDAMALLRVIDRGRDRFADYMVWTRDADVLKILDRIE